VSFGEDACGHIYVVSALGPVYRIEPERGPFACEPRVSPPRENPLSSILG
jgi:hypothetical protein